MTLEEAIKRVGYEMQSIYSLYQGVGPLSKTEKEAEEAYDLVLSAAEKWAATEWWRSVAEKERLAYIDDFHGTVSEYPLFAYRKAQEDEK